MADSPGVQVANDFNTGKIDWETAKSKLLAIAWPQHKREAPSAPADMVKAWNDADDDAFMPFPKGSLWETLSKLPHSCSADVNQALYDRAMAKK